MHAAGILRDIAADRAGDLRRRIGCIIEPGMRNRLTDGEIGYPGLGHDYAVVEIVLMTGEILRIGGKSAETGGYDLMGIITGSEGLLGVITEVTVRILQKPETARALMVGFAQVEAAGECVARIIGAGIIPGGMEMMDRPAIHAAEAFVQAGLSARRRSAVDHRTRWSRCRGR